MVVPVLALSAALILPSSLPTQLSDPPSTTESASTAMVPLPDPAISDAEYKSALTALLNDPSQRAGVYLSLVRYLPPSREYPQPAHIPVIVELLTARLDSPNRLEMIQPLRLLARCGDTARSAYSKVFPQTSSRIVPVRAAAVEAIGGMYSVAPGTPSALPAEAATVLLHLLQTDRAPLVRLNAAVAMGRAHLSSPEAIRALAAAAGGHENIIALGALDAAKNLGPDAHEMIVAIAKDLGEPRRVNNAAPALLSVAPPQEAVDQLTQTLSSTHDFTVRRTLIYYAGQIPKKKTGPDIRALALAVKPILAPLPPDPTPPPTAPETPPTPPPTTSEEPANSDPSLISETPRSKAIVVEAVKEEPILPPTADDLSELRIAAANTYIYLTGDITAAAVPLTELATDASSSPTVRQDAVLAIQPLGWNAGKDPRVVKALVAALDDSDVSVQNAAVTVLFKLGGPAAAAAAPRLSTLLLEAWQNKDNARYFQLVNALYRIGPVAAPSAKPVLKKIIAAEPKNSQNAQYARLALDHMTTN